MRVNQSWLRMTIKHSASRTVGRARRLRKESTFPEKLLWGGLRHGRLVHVKFRRQHPIGPYVADFYCHTAQLIIELDGDSHDGRAAEDRKREVYLNSKGYRVMRFLNDDVLQDLDSVLIAIARAVGVDDPGEHTLTRPLPEGEGSISATSER